MKIRLFATALPAALLVMLAVSCGGNSEAPGEGSGVFPRDVSLEEAGEVLGIDIPYPHYLPEGYEIQRVVLKNSGCVSLMISNGEGSEIRLDVSWQWEERIPFKAEPPTVDINGPCASSGSLFEGDDKNRITWNWSPERYRPGLGILTLSASKDLPIAELILVARSVGCD